MKVSPIVVIGAGLSLALVGGVLGLLLGVFAKYGVAELFTTSRESQAT